MGSNNKSLQAAKRLLADVRGKTMSGKDHRDLSIMLAKHLLSSANARTSRSVARQQRHIHQLVEDPAGQALVTKVTDQAFRSRDPHRVADQLHYLLTNQGPPPFLTGIMRIGFAGLKFLCSHMQGVGYLIVTHAIRSQMKGVILPGEPKPLTKILDQRIGAGATLNLNRLGEAIIGDQAAAKRVKLYLQDLKAPQINYISIKISTICAHLNVLAYSHTLDRLKQQLRKLYRAAMQSTPHKFVNLDMEEYKDLHLTCDLFSEVLSEPEFLSLSGGIVLQAYLPDSCALQQKITKWALDRVDTGGAPVKIRIVKGANLANEAHEASVEGWHQAPYREKVNADANFKLMCHYGLNKDRIRAVQIGVASHNLFDIAYCMILKAANTIDEGVTFEMLSGMATPLQSIVQEMTGSMVLYCPAATMADFHTSVAYLIRRLDENTAKDNYLRHSFAMTPQSPEWDSQVEMFARAIDRMGDLPRTINREKALPTKSHFTNQPSTDWCLQSNREWAHQIIDEWKCKEIETIPLVIGGKQVTTNDTIVGFDPSDPTHPRYHYCLADTSSIEKATRAGAAAFGKWSGVSVEERAKIAQTVARLLQRDRGRLIGAMILDGGKAIPEADREVSEAIDFLDYYSRNILLFAAHPHVKWRAKGCFVVTPPWNFPCAIPTGSIAGPLVCGNTVIFKPAPETVLVGWEIAKLFWEGGVPKEVLQFVNCPDEPTGSNLIKDPLIEGVVLTGATETARAFLNMRPRLDLVAETGGKNCLIISNMADRDLSLQDLVHSSFGHSGQKCSAASLAILHHELYDDPRFLAQLRDAAASLPVGSAWELQNEVVPLIKPAGKDLKRGLTELDPGEEWLLKPQRDPVNPHLWTPGIKLGVKPGSYAHQTEFFGPLLGVMRARSIDEAIDMANATQYGLTSGIHTLDEREISRWKDKIVAGNLYVNRTTTGAIVSRQPFGGCKASSFGRGSKAGGPNYLREFMTPSQFALPQPSNIQSKPLIALRHLAMELRMPKESHENLTTAFGSYERAKEDHFADRDVSQIHGQHNILSYRPRYTVIRITPQDSLEEVLQVVGAFVTAGGYGRLSYESDLPLYKLHGLCQLEHQDRGEFLASIDHMPKPYIRMIAEPSDALYQVVAKQGGTIVADPVLASGEYELLHYLREVAISHDYHRYGHIV